MLFQRDRAPAPIAIPVAGPRRIRAVGPCDRGMATADIFHLRRGMPAPAPLPSLRDALQRRAAIFGPVDFDVAPARPSSFRQRVGAVLRDLADLVEPSVRAS